MTMDFPKIVLIFLILLALSTFGHAVFVQLSAIGGPFTTDTNILVIAKVFDDNGSAKNNVDRLCGFIDKSAVLR